MIRGEKVVVLLTGVSEVGRSKTLCGSYRDRNPRNLREGWSMCLLNEGGTEVQRQIYSRIVPPETGGIYFIESDLTLRGERRG